MKPQQNSTAFAAPISDGFSFASVEPY
jgi:hypothetical protein